MERAGKMRILVDTNILFSALVFPQSKPARALLYIADNHEIVLCDRNIAELRDILGRKAPKYLPDAEVLLAEMSYELIPAVDHAEKTDTRRKRPAYLKRGYRVRRGYDPHRR